MTAREDRPSLPRPHSFRAWLLAARPKTLPLGVAPIIVGVAAALWRRQPIDILSAAAALGGSIAIQIATNFANDYFDNEKGTDDHTRVGPPRAMSAGLISKAAMKAGIILAFAAAFGFGLLLTVTSGWPVVVIGIVSILSGLAYTGGPYPLGYNGLGDVFVFVFFGPVAVGGVEYVVSGDTSLIGIVCGSILGALATNVLVVNNVRDVVGDGLHGKRTLAVRFGRSFGVGEYLLLLVMAAVGVVYVAVSTRWEVLLAVVPVLYGGHLWRTLRSSTDGETLNGVLAKTALMAMATSVFLAVTLAV